MRLHSFLRANRRIDSSRTASRTRARTRSGAVSLLCHPVREQHRVLGMVLIHTDKGQWLVRGHIKTAEASEIQGVGQSPWWDRGPL